MLNGNYSVSFQGPAGAGSGVAAVKDGAINGGDAGFGYMGKFQTTGNQITASLRVLQHTGGRGSVMGPEVDFTLNLQGTVTGDLFQITGGIPGRPGQKITIRGRKFAELA